MIKEKRFEYILSTLKENGTVTFSEISAAIEVSEDTVRRDIEYLHQNGLLSKVRGGAIPVNKNPLRFQDRTNHFSEKKEIIALKAQSFLKKGMTIFMDGGTTICAIAEHISTDLSLRIITNNLALVPIFQKFKNIELIILGGIYHRDTQTNIGTKTCTDTEVYVADLYLMGTCAISAEYGITSSFQEDGSVKRSMLKSAKKTIVVGNSSKIETSEHFKICDLSNIDALITELASDEKKLDQIRYKGIKII